jgi:hypothetical protein
MLYLQKTILNIQSLFRLNTEKSNGLFNHCYPHSGVDSTTFVLFRKKTTEITEFGPVNGALCALCASSKSYSCLKSLIPIQFKNT